MNQLRTTQCLLVLSILFQSNINSEGFTLTNSVKANNIPSDSSIRKDTKIFVATDIGIGDYEDDLREQNELFLGDETVRQNLKIEKAALPSWTELPKSSKTNLKVANGTFLESIEIYTGRIAMILAFIFFSVEMMTGMSFSQQVSVLLQSGTP